MKKILTLLLAFWTFLPCGADSSKIDDLYFNLDSYSKTAKVTLSASFFPSNVTSENYTCLTNAVVPNSFIFE